MTPRRPPPPNVPTAEFLKEPERWGFKMGHDAEPHPERPGYRRCKNCDDEWNIDGRCGAEMLFMIHNTVCPTPDWYARGLGVTLKPHAEGGANGD